MKKKNGLKFKCRHNSLFFQEDKIFSARVLVNLKTNCGVFLKLSCLVKYEKSLHKAFKTDIAHNELFFHI